MNSEYTLHMPLEVAPNEYIDLTAHNFVPEAVSTEQPAVKISGAEAAYIGGGVGLLMAAGVYYASRNSKE